MKTITNDQYPLENLRRIEHLEEINTLLFEACGAALDHIVDAAGEDNWLAELLSAAVASAYENPH